MNQNQQVNKSMKVAIAGSTINESKGWVRLLEQEEVRSEGSILAKN